MAKDKPQAKAPVEKDDKSADAAPPPVASAEAAPVVPEDAKGDYLISPRDLRRVFGEQDGDAPTATEAFGRLQQALGVQHAAANPRSAVYADLCFGVLCFARNRESYGAGVPRFRESDSERPSEADNEKALLVLTIADEMFQFAVTPAPQHEGRLPTLEQCYDKFRARVRAVSLVQPPPAENSSSSSAADSSEQPPRCASPPTLSAAEVASFVAFMSATFFRHLAAYQFVFAHARASVTRHVALCVESPLPPAPLASATLLAGDGNA